MFVPGRWAAAFINSLATLGGEAEDGLKALRILASWVKPVPGAVFGSAAGSSAAEKMETLVRRKMAASDASPGGDASGGTLPPALEAALRFFVLMIRKKAIRHIKSVIDETQKILDRKNGVIAVTLEHALPPVDESRIKEEIRKQTGAVRVDITEQVNPELIGGYRLRIGDEIIDASVRSQLQKLLTALQNGQTAGEGGT